MARFAIVDISNLYYRASRATKGNAFDRMGMGMHSTFSALRKMIFDMDCDHIVICAEGYSWRYGIYPEYKGSRRLEKARKTDEEREEEAILLKGLESMIEFFKTGTRMTVLHSKNVEGDDFVARFIQLHPHDEHIILSSDSDFIQLIAPNVTIFDAMLDRVITREGVKDQKGRDMLFEIKPSTGKITIKGTIEELKTIHEREQKKLKKADPLHDIQPFEWSIDDNWWERALFVKLVRGDSGDGIFSAYPGVRYKGTQTKVGIEAAWADRFTKGFDWNNFMNQSWDRITKEEDEKGNPIKLKVTVKDAIEENRKLIDLTAQPAHVLDEMDAAIVTEIQKGPVESLGSGFLRFCAKNALPRIAKDAMYHTRYLNSGYPME